MAESEHERGERLDQFWTVEPLAKAIAEWANIAPGDSVLEPSCGGGDFVRHITAGAAIKAMDLDSHVFAKWDRELLERPRVERITQDFLRYRTSADAFDVALMNPPYGFVGSGKTRKAADRLHVQHALRFSRRVVVLARANFLWGVERYSHVFRFAELTRMAVLVHRPAFYGPALLAHQQSARHDFGVFEFCRRGAREQRGSPVDSAKVEFWTQSWKVRG